MHKLIAAVTILLAPPLFAHATSLSGGPVLHGPAGTVAFGADNGSIIAVTPSGSRASVWHSGEHGLWSVRFDDGSTLNAAAFHATNTVNTFSWKTGPDTNALTLSYTCPALTLRVVATRTGPDGIAVSADVSPRYRTVLNLDLPGRLRFDPDTVTRFISPISGNTASGAAFNRAFFQPQPLDRPAGWQTVVLGPAGYRALCGEPLVQRDVNDPPVPLAVTDEGRRWFTPALAARIGASRAVVNRAPTRTQANLVLIAAANGPYLSANRLGGDGGLWRVGGGVRENDAPLALAVVCATIEKLATEPTEPRTRLGLMSLPAGPERGNWCDVTVADWREHLASIAARSRGRVTFAELDTPRAMLEAAAGDHFLCILNPYGEAIPTTADGAAGMTAAIDAVRAYVRGGGNWFEVGGYPFYQALRPLPYLNYSASYPTAFADWMHLESHAGSAALYRIQPRTVAHPWDAAGKHAAIFVAGSLGCGGDAHGGYCDHAFSPCVHPGETWHSPIVRLTLGTPARKTLADYAAENALTRPLTEKIKPDVLDRLKRSVLVFLGGSCRQKIDALGKLPVPTLIHFSDYLHGGFDKEYPDHLPPNPAFGTPAEFHEFFDRAHALGHLVSPYTNPTWWCDHPRGPTFLREGDAPLLKDLDGKPVYERYSHNDGWTITFWHPAVQAANRVTVRQFTREYPVDILFQDQCGARRWHYDTNPASPTPYAYTEGILAMNDEDSRIVPLATENGWDRVANYQTMLCGMSWGIVPTDHHPSWVRLLKATLPPDTWEIYPLAEALMHDKAIFLHHDLGQFVTNDRVLAWSLALGYNLSFRAAAPAVARDAPREWLAWLDRIQKSVCARYTGKPLGDFRHDRAPLFATAGNPRRPADDGIIRATYGDVHLLANLGDVPRTIDGVSLPPYGFRAEAPGMTAGLAPDGAGYVTETTGETTELWIHGRPLATATVPVPPSVTALGHVRLAFDGAPATTAEVAGSALTIPALPERGETPRTPPPSELASIAPRDWPGNKPAIGILDLGPGIAPALARVSPAAWRAAFEGSALATQYGLPVKPLATYDALAAALAAGPRAFFAIVNPYGETFPCAGPGRWRETLQAVRRYVNNGGTWWETAAYSFHRACYKTGDAWKWELTAAAGMQYLNLPIGDGDVDEPAEPMHVTQTGRAWLGGALADALARRYSVVNRGVPSTDIAPATLLVTGLEQNFIGGYRLDGWGMLWRIGGFNPDPDVAVPVAVAATLHQYTHPPAPLPPAGLRYLYHTTLVSFPRK